MLKKKKKKDNAMEILQILARAQVQQPVSSWWETFASFGVPHARPPPIPSLVSIYLSLEPWAFFVP